MLFSSRVRVGVRFSVWFVSGYAHVRYLQYFPLSLLHYLHMQDRFDRVDAMLGSQIVGFPHALVSVSKSLLNLKTVANLSK